MKQKQFLILAAIAFVALLGALMLSNQRAPESLDAAQRKLAPTLESGLNMVSQMKITGAGNALIVTLNKTDESWVVVEKSSYPANVNKVREVLLALANAKVLEEKTSQKELYSKLGVEDLSDATATGVRVDLSGGKTPLSVIIGQPGGQGSNSTFVRLSDQPQSLLVSGLISAPKVASEWLKKELIDVQAADVQSVVVSRADGSVTVSKSKREEQNFVVENLPAKREASSEFAANGLAGFVGTLNFDDVSARTADFAVPAGAFTLDSKTFDGRIYTAQLWEADGKQMMVLSARFDAAQAQAHKAAAAPAPAADSDQTAKTAHQAELAKAATDFTGALAKAQTTVDAVTAEVKNWVYTIPSFKFAQANKSMSDMLKPLEAPTDKTQ